MITDRLRDLLRRPLPLRIVDVKASRALFVNEGVQEVEIRLKVDSGDQLTLILPLDSTHKLITNLATAYNAARPPIKGLGQTGAGWNGMT